MSEVHINIPDWVVWVVFAYLVAKTAVDVRLAYWRREAEKERRQ